MEHSDDPDGLAQARDAWLSVVRAHHECSATLAQLLEPLGLSVLQHEILLNLRVTPGLTQQHLSRRCFSAKSGVSMIVAQFEKDGIVHRTRSEQDQRAWSLSLSPAGEILAVKAAAVQADVVQRMAQPFSMAELDLLRIRMEQSSEHLRQMRDEVNKS